MQPLFIQQALVQAFPQGNFQHHRTIILNRQMNLEVVDIVPPDGRKLSLSEMITLIETFCRGWLLEERAAVGERLFYMKDRRLVSCITSYSEKMFHSLQGRGFITTNQRAERLCNFFIPVDSQSIVIPLYYELEEALNLNRQVVRKGYYNAAGQLVNIAQGLLNGKIYEEPGPLPMQVPPSAVPTEFRVVEEDGIDFLGSLDEFNPAGLSFDPFQMCYRSNFFDTFASLKVELREFTYIYLSKVSVFRKNERLRYGFMDAPKGVTFVNCRSYTLTPLSEDRRKLGLHPTNLLAVEDFNASQAYITATELRIRHLLRCAFSAGHRRVVFTDWSYAWNPPECIAAAASRIFDEPEFKNRFTHVYFASADARATQIFRENFPS
jgi:hypothetical protein